MGQAPLSKDILVTLKYALVHKTGTQEVYTIRRCEGVNYILQTLKGEEIKAEYRPGFLRQVPSPLLEAIQAQQKRTRAQQQEQQKR